jgi:AraC-like DNA-binding protein
MGRPKGSKNKTVKPSINKGGRPKISVDFETIDKLMAIQCTGEEIASVLNVSYDTLEKRIKEEYGLSFTEYFSQKSGVGRASLRRRQFQLAESGNPTMLVWLGKQWLNQKDRSEIDTNYQTDKLDMLIKQFDDTDTEA